MSNDIIPKIIFVIAIVICIIILLLPPPKTNSKKLREKLIKNFSTNVPNSSQNTKLTKIKLETNYNNFKNSANKTPILLGDYDNDIKTPVNLKVIEIDNNTYIFSTIYKNESYYLSYSSQGNKGENLEKGQLYWTKNKKDQISFLRNDKNILFVKNLQLYFKWSDNNPNNRKTDYGIFILRNKNEVVNDPNIVTFIFDVKV